MVCRFVVAGASGLVGTHALRALAGRPEVQVTAIFHRRPPVVRAANITAVQADLTDAGECRRVFDGADRALLFAGLIAPAPVLARDPVGAVTANIRLAVTMLEAAWQAQVPRLVWLSSTTGYPDAVHPLAEDDMFRGEPPPVWAGLGEAARYCERFAHYLHGVAARAGQARHMAVLRPSLIYGEHDHFDDASAHFLPALIRRVVARERPIEVWGDGNQARDIIHAADVAAAALMAVERVEGCTAFNIAAGTSYSVNELLGKLIALDGFTDADIVHRLDRPQSAAVRRFAAGKAERELGFRPAIGLEEGLRRTLAWYRAERFGQGRSE